MTIQHDKYADGETFAEPVVDEPNDSIFSWQDLARLDDALTMASRETGLRFTLYVGDLGKQTRIKEDRNAKR